MSEVLRAVGICIVIDDCHTRLCQYTDGRIDDLIFTGIRILDCDCLILPCHKHIAFFVLHECRCCTSGSGIHDRNPAV